MRSHLPSRCDHSDRDGSATGGAAARRSVRPQRCVDKTANGRPGRLTLFARGARHTSVVRAAAGSYIVTVMSERTGEHPVAATAVKPRITATVILLVIPDMLHSISSRLRPARCGAGSMASGGTEMAVPDPEQTNSWLKAPTTAFRPGRPVQILTRNLPYIPRVRTDIFYVFDLLCWRVGARKRRSSETVSPGYISHPAEIQLYTSELMHYGSTRSPSPGPYRVSNPPGRPITTVLLDRRPSTTHPHYDVREYRP